MDPDPGSLSATDTAMLVVYNNGSAQAIGGGNNIVDTLYTLRCADALRQRGTVLKTSGKYEVFVDQTTAKAVYTLRRGSQHLFTCRLEKD